ncbi:mitochondrial Homoaconitase [Bacidia gigantensis]|uniref:mitochondrial Homoaconitase n=1 Tax=Bacidia gigantensis TaxID=2732470 RepID=UPI001D047C17|nr:mitochondrial Homoaconitase [Bacidia gigantensis]KAG8531972.1 mitochondrial Homoaconitase [Bacidia gigantensis]
MFQCMRVVRQLVSRQQDCLASCPQLGLGIPKCRPRTSCQQVRPYTRTPHRQAEVFPSQIQDPSAAAVLSSLQTKSHVPQTLTEKIIQRYAVGLPEEGKAVKAGDYVSIQPHHCMTHDNSWPVATKFMSIGASKLHNPRQIVMTLDHDVQNKSETNLKKYRLIEEFAKKQGADFYPAGRGIGHQIMVEEGYAWPGTLVVASDRWQIPPIAKITFTGALPQGVTAKDVIIALCGTFNKDEVLNHAIEFVGEEETMRSLSVDARLTIANMTTEHGALSGLFQMDTTLEKWLRSKATEASLYDSASLSDALTPKRFTHSRLDELFRSPISADKGAKYAKYLHLNLSTLAPYISGPNSVKIATPLEELEAEKIKIDKAYLVSCTNSRASDLAAAARVFKDAVKANGGKGVAIPDHVKFFIAAASMPEQLAAEEAGDWQAMLDAGATALPAGCGPCIGLGAGLLEPGEVGRMGSTDAKAYLGSPEVVAASALQGKLMGPGWYRKPENWAGVVMGEGDGIREADRMITAEESLEKIIGQLDNAIEEAETNFGGADSISAGSEEAFTEILPGFPETVEGEIVFCDADNINTDAIYPGKYTYQDDITPKKMAEVCMENYDPTFGAITKAGDILVSGFNFGTGSSREQAASSLVAKQIPLVVAGSFGNIFSRNSINNALMGIETPRLIHRLRKVFSGNVASITQQKMQEPLQNKDSLDSPPPAPQATPKQENTLTRRTGWKLTWDVRRSKITVQEGQSGDRWTEKIGELPPNVQEIIARGGLEKWVRNEIKSSG